MFIHTVLMAFGPETDAAFHAAVQAHAARIRDECEGTVHYFYGANEADRAGGFTHAVVGCFTDEAAHVRYQVSAAHVAMKTFMGPHIRQLVVFDSGAMV